jgi:hypothetical protein
MRSVRRTGGDFWQDCRQCGKRAQASLTEHGMPVLCDTCASERAQERLPNPNDYERGMWRASGGRSWPLVTMR